MKILITGSSGFVGSHLAPYLASKGHIITSLSRTSSLRSTEDYSSLLMANIHNADAVVHLAGIAHRTGTSAAEYDKHNFILTKTMADIALNAKLKHFIFLSTAKVHGEESLTPFNSKSAFDPKDAYSESKAKAEIHLAGLDSDTTFTAVRPPVVYGQNPKANIERLATRLINRKIIPVPIRPNIRSFISINNLLHALSAILETESFRHKAYLVDDQQPTSTEEFISRLSRHLGVAPRFVKIPNNIFSLSDNALSYIFQEKSLAPMHRNFEIRCDLLEEDTGWRPIESMEIGLSTIFSNDSE